MCYIYIYIYIYIYVYMIYIWRRSEADLYQTQAHVAQRNGLGFGTRV